MGKSCTALSLIDVTKENHSRRIHSPYLRFAVATVMITTTALISFQIVLVKRRPVLLALAFFVFFGFFDGLFWGASFRKVPEGAWVPLMFGVVL